MTQALRNSPYDKRGKLPHELVSQRWLSGVAKAMEKGSMPQGYFVAVYRAAPFERHELIKFGIDAAAASIVARALNMRLEQLINDLGFVRSAVARKARNKEKLSTDQSERIVGLMKLIGQVEKMVAESGDPEGFDAAQWLGEWLQQPNPALGRRRPADLMDTLEGQKVVSNLVSRMQTGAYS